MELNQVEVVHSTKLPWKEVPIIPIGDLQIQPNRELFDEKRFRKVIEWGVEHDAYYVGMGDFVDFASPSNRGKLRSAIADGHLYDSAVDAMDAAAEEHLRWVMELLEPTRGRWLGLLEGHHMWEFQSGMTTDMKLAEYLGCPFLGTAAYINVRFDPPKEWKKSYHNLVIWAHHGRAGGRLLSTPLNQLENVIKGFDADVYLVGHHHKAVAGRMSRIYPKFNPSGKHELVHKDVYIACTGSFLKGWMENQRRGGRPSATYAEKGMMNPLALGHIVIWARPRWGDNNDASIEISVEV